MLTSFLCAALWLGPDAMVEDRRELEKLQGEWVMETVEYKGRPSGFNPRSVAPTWTIKGNEYSWTQNDGSEGRLTFRLDASKDPMHFDTVFKDGQVQLGIFKIEGDLLTICRAAVGDRPTTFKTMRESENKTVVFKRVK